MIDLDDIECRIANGIYGECMTQAERNDAFSALSEVIAEVERLRIVAHLRRETYPSCAACNNQLADSIERGDHLKEDR